MSWVDLERLNKAFAGISALRDFNLTIGKGEFVSLLGPSGCGKTTTLRIVAGFERPDAGAVRVGGEDILAMPPHRRGIGIVFQNYALFPHLNAADNIAFGMRIARRATAEIRARVSELLDLVGLPEVANKMPRQLSGGQQQRIALARALAINPRVLLLDEPLSALDAVVRVHLRDEIRRIQSALGVTTIWVTHDQEEALAVSDRIVVMHQGAIEQVGRPEDIYGRPASRFVASFIGKMNQFEGEIIDAAAGRVQWGSHTLSVPTNEIAGYANGRRVTLLVRPESVVVAAPNAAPVDRDGYFLATVETSTFLGGIRRLLLNVGDKTLIADIPAAAEGAAHRGDSVSLFLPGSACRVLPEALPTSEPVVAQP
jgi:putative spermidine/putrescine transport system ATP-binding protein